MVAFILSVVVDINKNLDWLKYITPFKYFDAQTLITGGSLDPVYVILSVLIITALVYVTYASYKKRDLKV